jgi:hypothetical protein
MFHVGTVDASEGEMLCCCPERQKKTCTGYNRTDKHRREGKGDTTSYTYLLIVCSFKGVIFPFSFCVAGPLASSLATCTPALDSRWP